MPQTTSTPKPEQKPVSVTGHYDNTGELAILFDSSKCSACKGCQVACKCWNELPSSLTLNAGEFTGSLQNPPDLQPNNRVIITYNEKKNENRRYGVDWAFGRRACMHCTDAACVTVCPSGCLYHDENGFVTYQRYGFHMETNDWMLVNIATRAA